MSCIIAFFGCDTTSQYANYLEYAKSTYRAQGGLNGSWKINQITCNEGPSNWKDSEIGIISIVNSSTGTFSYSPFANCTLSFPISVTISSQNQVTFTQNGLASITPSICYANSNPTMSSFTGSYSPVNNDQITIKSSNMTDYCPQGTVGVITLDKQSSRF